MTKRHEKTGHSPDQIFETLGVQKGMRPAKERKLTSGGEVFSLRAQRKAAPKV